MNYCIKEHNLVIRHIFDKFMDDTDFVGSDGVVSEDAVGHCPSSMSQFHPPDVYGKEDIKKIDIQYKEALQFTNIQVGEMISMQDKVFVRWGADGIHRKDFFGITASHKTFSITGQTLYRFNKDNQVCEAWQAWDMLGLFNQIGWQSEKDFKASCKRSHRLSTMAASLSEREKLCLKFLTEGKTAKETAEILFLSPRTIEYYFENIKNKLDCLNKRELFNIAHQFAMHHLI